MMGTTIVIALVVILGFAICSGIAAANAQQKAKELYRKSLAELKFAPTNADLKQRTLALGPPYSNLTRDKKGITLFDEVALMNDINAACAAASVIPTQLCSAPSAQTQTVEARLKVQIELKEKGLVEEAEYERRRQEVLASI